MTVAQTVAQTVVHHWHQILGVQAALVKVAAVATAMTIPQESCMMTMMTPLLRILAQPSALTILVAQTAVADQTAAIAAMTATPHLPALRGLQHRHLLGGLLRHHPPGANLHPEHPHGVQLSTTKICRTRPMTTLLQ